MCTISPDPLLNDYGEELPNQQYRRLNRWVTQGIKQLMKKYDVFKFSIHYELNKDLNLHIHMLISLSPDMVDYDIHCSYISKTFHRILGRKGNRAMVSAHTVWLDKDRYIKYVNKENAYPAYHCFSPINEKSFTL